MGRFTAKLATNAKGEEVYQVADQGRHFADFPKADWERDSKEIVASLEAGKPWVPNEPYAGKLMKRAEAAAMRQDVLLRGSDVTRQVSPWVRHLAAAEVTEGGVMDETLRLLDAEPWACFVRELYDALYTEKPADLSQPAKGYEWVRELLHKAEDGEQWRKLHERVRGDAWAAGLACGRVAKQLRASASDALKEVPKVDPQRQEEEAESAEQLFGKKSPMAKQLRNLAKESMGRAATALRRLQRLDAEDFGLTAFTEQGATDALVELAAMDAGVDDMAGLGSGALRSLKGTPEQMRGMLEGNPGLKKLVELAGRLRIRARRKQRTRTKYAAESIVDVTLGGELERLIPAELAQLTLPATKLNTLRRLQERECLQYDLEGTEDLDRGPVIVAVDGSGSMSGLRNQWAMAVAISLLEVAAMQRRPFVLMHFDDQVQKTFEVPKPAQLGLVELVEMVGFFSGGGTNFGPPLSEAQRIITRKEPGKSGNVFRKADVVLVTDGQAGWGGTAQALKATGAALYGVAIECSFRAEQLEEFAGVAQVSAADLQGTTPAVDLLFGI